MVFVICVILMASDYYGQYMGTMRNLLTTTLEPLERAAAIPSQVQKWYNHKLQDTAILENQILQLNTENIMLKARLLQMKSLEQELDRHRRLLGTTGRMDARSVRVASVLFYSSTPLTQYLTINKGSLDNIKINQPVIDANGLIGQITSLTPTSSRIMKITDPNHQTPVRVLRTGQRGIATGLGHSQLSLDFIPITANIQPGDTLVTSGLGGIFPAGYPVATITEIIKTEGLSYLNIKAKPIADLDNTHEVLILFTTRSPNELRLP
ncbi:rod shape-determining protein MreC [Thiomicrospira sp. R3]|uniref:rod shape-determining protein MreC n=1 Tax=Thiomicrospira sp. R3 TaxID=3035472 RepID=UPI00259BA94F|nr:rod shape-determining protein MreC [Thiomicrospira sp. R3]WFE69775.1 rod shape-determining protein MreC [Thiomicrospira sp. R3]